MQYAVISDTHDNFYNFQQAMKILAERGIRKGFHLGDFCAPGFPRAMAEHKDFNWICVFGNVDGDKAKIMQEQSGNPNFDIVPEHFREVALEDDGIEIFLTHYPTLARNAAESGEYKTVFYGHNHLKSQEVLENGTLLANPGELVGFKTGQPSFAIWNSQTNGLELIDLKDFRVAK